MNLTWHTTDGVHYGYDGAVPGSCRVYRKGDLWRCTTLVNAAVVDDDAVGYFADDDLDGLLTKATDVVDAAMHRRAVRLNPDKFDTIPIDADWIDLA